MDREKELVYVIGHKNPDTDSICAAIGYADYLNQRGSLPGLTAVSARAGEINAETAYVLNYFKATAPTLLKDASGQKLVLVDHAEHTHMAKGVESAEILGVLDHHKVAFFHHSPIFFHTEAVGATATLVAKKYFEDEHLGIKLTPQIAGLLLAAILSDTVIFKSSTTTSKDTETAKRLAAVAGIFDVEKLGIDLKKAGIAGAKSVGELVNSGFKEWDLGGKKVGVSQIEVVDLPSILLKKDELLDKITKIYHRGGYFLVVLMLTDVIKVGTQLLTVGDATGVYQAFNNGVSIEEIYIDGMLSRKKDLLPPLTKALTTIT